MDPSEDLLPLDFTSVSSRAIGAIHSRYAVRHAHALYVLAGTMAELAVAKRNLGISQAKFRIKHYDDYKEKWRVDAEMQNNAGISKLEEQVVRLEATAEMLKAVTDGYEDFRNAASREMFRRGTEKPPND